ncbi:MAG: DUF3413 domain-containing protein [Proteobacteria bacterium]|nr:DUF3413 domain-containing protein [Pseudomonadota bacterium]
MNSTAKTSTAVGRSRLLRFIGWFSAVNALLLGLIGTRFLLYYGLPEGVLAGIYLLLAWTGYYSVLAFVPFFLLSLPLLLFWPRRGVVTGVLVFVAAFLAAALLLDSLVYAENRFHITLLTAKILGWQSWLFFGIYFFIGLMLETMLGKQVWQWVEGKKKRGGRLLAGFILFSIIASQLIHIWADAAYYTPVTSLSQYLPGYRGTTAKRTMVNLDLVDLNQARERSLARRLADNSTGGQLSYPLNPMRCTLPGEKLNVLLILVDAMRSDLLSYATAPNLMEFSTRAGQFTDHYSGGNSSRIGVFSLFYGLPPNDQLTIEAVQQPAVLINQLQQANYRFGIFSSSPIYRPVQLDRTAFANIPNLRISTKPENATHWRQDEIIVDEWREFLDQQDQQPFFGFLFFAAVNGGRPPPEYRPKFDMIATDPMPEKQAKYSTAMHFVDGLIQQVLDDLEERGLLESTVVIVSSDHGEEFDETGQGFRKHGSAYTDLQLKVPMLIHWPGKGAGVFDHRSSHYDVAPTLLKGVLGCNNPEADYSLGHDLYSRKSWPWLLVGSYYNEAVVSPDDILISFPGGGFEVRDRQYRLIDKPQLDKDLLRKVMQQRSRYHSGQNDEE